MLVSIGNDTYIDTDFIYYIKKIGKQYEISFKNDVKILIRENDLETLCKILRKQNEQSTSQ